jgi:hypothetical protein
MVIVNVCGKEYPTKENAIREIKTYYKSLWENKRTLSTEDKKNLKRLLSLRRDLTPEYIDKIDHFRIVTNQYHQFEIQYHYCNEWIGFAIDRCIIGKPNTPLNKQNALLREAISPQIFEFRHANRDRKCELCQSTENIQVDHVGFNFTQIVNQFLRDKNIQFVQVEHISDFINYHREVAKYRYLCGSCNIQAYRNSIGRPRKLDPVEQIQKNRERARERYWRLKKDADKPLEAEFKAGSSSNSEGEFEPVKAGNVTSD